MSDYDIGEAFAKIEDELIASMMRNIDRHRAEETKEGYEWSMWQTEQLQALEKYKKENARKYPRKFKDINDRISALISIAHDEGRMKQEEVILKAIRNGFSGTKKRGKGIDGEFFRLSERKLEALINATMNDMQNAETAILRMANDKYRSTIFNAQVYYNTGAGTFEKAVDMATKDMLAAGLNCVQYKNGARHRLEDYAGMALRTASTRAKLYGEGEMRQEWGVHTVIMNKRANPCPKCLPFVGKVMIDDVWSGGKASDGPYPLMSSAIAAGLYHPNCKDMHTTFFPGISDAPDDTWTPAELEDVQMFNETEARQQYAERQEEKFGRLAKYSLDPENKKRYEVRKKQWEKAQINSLKKEFSNMTDGYSYDDFIKDFGTIDNGFEGASQEDIDKAREIDKKIRSIIGEKVIDKELYKTKDESIHNLELIGIGIRDNSNEGISEKIISKYADFITNFEQNHAGYFNNNKIQLENITIVDKLEIHGVTAAGGYYNDSKSIKLAKKLITTKPSSKLVTYSMSDDYEMHFLAHEYGHYIADTLEKNLSITDYDVIQNSLLRYFDGDIFKTNVRNLSAALGSYGSRNAHEAFAEAFAEAYTCEKPRKFASIFKEELEKVLGKGNEWRIAKDSKNDIIISGARILNPDDADGLKFAKMYYEEIRSFSTDTKKIAKNLGKEEADIKKVKSYLFEDKVLYDSDMKEYKRFEPDCAIAQSWQRLIIGKDIKKHDMTLIEHELLEMRIKRENPGIEHHEAHRLASNIYNYPKEAEEYYGNLKKHKKSTK